MCCTICCAEVPYAEPEVLSGLMVELPGGAHLSVGGFGLAAVVLMVVVLALAVEGTLDACQQAASVVSAISAISAFSACGLIRAQWGYGAAPAASSESCR